MIIVKTILAAIVRYIWYMIYQLSLQTYFLLFNILL